MHPVQSCYSLNDVPIKESDHIKYLGVHIDSKLTWNKHIDSIVCKAINIKGLLQRNLKYCPTQVKHLCYISMIRPILEYASTAWSAYTIKNITKLEKVQKTSLVRTNIKLHFIAYSYSYIHEASIHSVPSG